ncbi:MAG: hypothetical protein IJ086_16075 [Clostridium sp.]|nr:hypothetical protein [Clostridium sp.]
MQLNEVMNVENVRELESVIDELMNIKFLLKKGEISEDDRVYIKSVLFTKTSVLAENIENSLEMVTYLKPYLKKSGETYNLTIGTEMANKFGFTEDFRSIVYILDETRNVLMVKSTKELASLGKFKLYGGRVYKASKSKVTSKGLSYNLGIPKDILDTVYINSDEKLKIAVRNDIIEISQ